MGRSSLDEFLLYVDIFGMNDDDDYDDDNNEYTFHWRPKCRATVDHHFVIGPKGLVL